ncbi:defensin-like [Schistocerca piceifrons]|uniref:defensin-like n=1 Tax=Schistocerca piceifrons TaxID=274613 RepID=UPI001F5FBD45|nr:defensin-like [Schistocerca piceifrons]XP_049799065.1 defensin-like [Schistocerca nitens]XP_049855844.1 defensin-like [Schistocerca gregaria]
MRTCVAAVLLALVTFAILTSAAPAGGEDEHGDRHVRVTCDLLSAFGVEDSACAARCIAMNKGYKGGHCEDGVCHCRK